MPRKNGAARAEPPAPTENRSGDKFNVRTSVVFGERIRYYCGLHRIPFNELAIRALEEYLSRHPRWTGPSIPLPRGTRLGVTRIKPR
jgi:hypothetical protein